MSKKPITEARLKKAAKIWAFSVLANIDLTEFDNANEQVISDSIREEAKAFAVNELQKLGITEIVNSERQALDLVLCG